MINFKCEKCGFGFRMINKPNFCPNCGSKEWFGISSKALTTAKQIMAEIEKIDEELLPLKKRYLELLNTRSRRKTLLATYQLRGVITKEELDRYSPKNLKV